MGVTTIAQIASNPFHLIDGFARLLVDDVKHRRQILADRVGAVPSGQPLGLRIEERHDALRARQPAGERRRPPLLWNS